MWVLDDPVKDRAIVDEINRLDDRAAAIIAVGYLERGLEITLRSNLRDNKRLLDKFFRGMGPLATFSAKIDLGYLLGIYPEVWHQCLHSIRRIRNIFSHDPTPMDFTSAKIQTAGNNLVDPKVMIARLKDALNPHNHAKNPEVGRLFIFLDQMPIDDGSFRAKFMGAAQFSLFNLRLKETMLPGRSGLLDLWTPEVSQQKS